MNPCRDFLAIIKHIETEKVSRQLTFLCYNGAIVRVEVLHNMKSTDDLVNEIKESSNILDFLAENHEEMQLNGLTKYLEAWIQEKNLSKADVVRRSNLNRAYVYQIFLGRKYPSRDKVIALAFGLGLTADETQKLLKQAGYRELYPRDPRDALLLYAVGHGMTILEANQLLYDNNIDVLE